MPGHGIPQVKCEPTSESDDEDSNSQFALQYTPKQVPSKVHFRPVKGEPDSSVTTEDDVESSIMRNLQTPSTLEELAPLTPAAPAATPVCAKQEVQELTEAPAAAMLETLEPAPYSSISHHMEHHMSLMSEELPSEFMPLMAVKEEPMSEGEQPQLSGEETNDSCAENISRGSPKSWSQQDMENALEALRSHHMSLTRASATFGIPSTTLWQRAHRLGIDTPKKDGGCKSWGEPELRAALRALRAGAISANKASKAYGIPSSTLYKIARREGIRLAAPFNAAPTSWRPADLEQALRSIRTGHNSVQRASAQYGIPTGTLYGRCKREGIELSRSNPTPWSEDAMGEALEAVRVGQMSINQAAIHYNLPYSSLYGRFKRCKYPQSALQLQQIPQECPEMNAQSQQNPEMYQQYHQHPITHPVHPDPIDHTSPVHYHQSPMQHMSDPQISNQMHDPAMLSNVMFHEQNYAMHYNQAHNGITTS